MLALSIFFENLTIQALIFRTLSLKILINLVVKSKKENPINNPSVPPIDPMTFVIS